MDEELPDLTEGFLLDGRVNYTQPRGGYRTGIEPVLLAAAVPARTGERVLEAGCGAGAGLLCLTARMPGILGVGVERDPALAALARHNFAQNAFDTLAVQAMDLLELPRQAWFDHVFANPPWHGENSSASPDAGRDQAKRARAGLLEEWIAVLLAVLQPGGTIRLILPAEQFARACGCLEDARAGEITLLPLWPRAGVPARLVLVGGRKGRKGAARLLPGLVLHQGEVFSPAAGRILRDGDALKM